MGQLHSVGREAVRNDEGRGAGVERGCSACSRRERERRRSVRRGVKQLYDAFVALVEQQSIRAAA